MIKPPHICAGAFLCQGELYYQVQQFRKIKKFIQNTGRMELRHNTLHRKEFCMNYTHLTIEERSCIRKYYVDGLSCRKIAELIGRSPSLVPVKSDATAHICMTFLHTTLTQHRKSIYCGVPIAIEECSSLKMLSGISMRNCWPHGHRNKSQIPPVNSISPASERYTVGSMKSIW